MNKPSWALDDPAQRRERVHKSVQQLAGLLDAEAEFLIVVPPFASPDRPSLGATIVAQAARRAGCPSSICYANLSFAQIVGPSCYRELCHTPTSILFGERIFSFAYYGRICSDTESKKFAEIANLSALQLLASEWVGAVAEVLASHSSKYLGFSTTFEQTLSSLSIARQIKRLNQSKIIFLGGANADGEMGKALADLESSIDYVLVGEAEAEIYRFFCQPRSLTSATRLIKCQPNDNLEILDCPDYNDFYFQVTGLCIEECSDPNMALTLSDIHIPYESSRGCWWGAKHHCSFCGLNANGMVFRQKSADKVIRECQELVRRHETTQIVMTDNIMPSSYFSTLLPELSKIEKDFTLFYEQKANINAKKMRLLKLAGVTRIQPGIESLSTSILRLMRKGTTATININCLRFARFEGIDLAWNLLCDFPGDNECDYLNIERLVPILEHLQPPSGVSPLIVDRFSPYHNEPDAFDISEIRPLPAYSEVHPSLDKEQLAKIAYHFEATYSSVARRSPDVIGRLAAVVNIWRDRWMDDQALLPEFRLFSLSDGRSLVLDTRKVKSDYVRIASSEDVRTLLCGADAYSARIEVALDRGELACVDGKYIPLIVAEGLAPA